MVRALLISLLAVLALAAPAQATPGAGMVRQFTSMGVEFWAARSVAMCPEPDAMVTPLPSMVAGVEANGCGFWISSTLAKQASRERWQSNRDGDSVREQLCATVFHELGHVAGLGHTTSGLMAPVGGAIPYQCVRWVSKRERLERRAWRDRRANRGRGEG